MLWIRAPFPGSRINLPFSYWLLLWHRARQSAASFFHFIFDAGVGGLYLGLFGARRLTLQQRRRMDYIRPWVLLLIAWPVLLFFVPQQTPLVQLVGLRKAVWFLPFHLDRRYDGGLRLHQAGFRGGIATI